MKNLIKNVVLVHGAFADGSGCCFPQISLLYAYHSDSTLASLFNNSISTDLLPTVPLSVTNVTLLF